ncbi:hypothetical protein BD779DRAFT_105887 [Infundibulicybe gibba]|nr:hypothetical protein BD779DRAFT_105887 [Infundibulicybe gibba]
MANIGSVFLGDFQRLRVLSSSSTPPSSPPPTSMSGIYSSLPSPQLAVASANAGPEAKSSPASKPPPAIEPALALELRIRWLEAILLGVRKGKDTSPDAPLLALAADVQHRLSGIVDENDGLKRFMDHYEAHAHVLTPAFALGTTTDSPAYKTMAPEEAEALLTEMEPDVRAADRDMRDIEALEQRGVISAGKLAALQPRLDALIKAHEEDAARALALEKRVTALMERHATHVDALSELFVVWDDTITEAEDRTSKLERERSERRRMGLE